MSKLGFGAVERAAMHAADAAGREHPDPRRVARDHRRRDGRRAPARRAAIAAPRFRRDTLSTVPRGAVASASSSSPDSPTSSRPSLSATVAGTAPVDRIAASDAVATSTFCGIRQAVADERGLEGDDGAAVAQRVGDLGGDGEVLGADHAAEGTSGPGVA